MSDVLTHSFLHLRHPILSLAERFGAEIESVLHDAIGLVFNQYEDMYFNAGRTNLPAAYNDAHDYIEGAILLFNQYEKDYPMGFAERASALAAWLCQDCIDPSNPDIWGAIGPDALGILAFLEKDENTFPLLSEADHDPALALNIGLRLLTSLDFRAEYHCGKRPGLDFYIDPDMDRHDAFRVLNDRPARETDLSLQCRLRAKDVIDALRGRVLGRHIHPL